jgi:Protein of unknown function (DUF982)
MVKDLWARTVTIELGGTSRQYLRIESTRHAASVLLDEWPASTDAAYREAIIGCTRALKGEIPHDDACDRFIAAARAAELPVVDSVFDEEDAFELELARTIRESLVADTGRGSSYAH